MKMILEVNNLSTILFHLMWTATLTRFHPSLTVKSRIIQGVTTKNAIVSNDNIWVS